MLINIKNKLRRSNRKNPELKITPGETIRDTIIKTGFEAAQESSYTAGNITEKLVNVATSVGDKIDLGTQITVGSESTGAIGIIVFKTTKDISRGDSVCTGLCLVSETCETIALACSTIPVIPFRGKIYMGGKVVSRGWMTYRNLCLGEGC